MLLSKQTEGEILVDVGCDTGNILKLAGNKFKTLIGVDISEKSLDKASEFCNMTINSDICKISKLDDNSISAITGYSVLHHLYDPIPLFKECYRLLKPGGYVYFDNDPNASFDRIQKIKNRFLPKKIKNLIKYFLGKSISSTAIDTKNEYNNLIDSNIELYEMAEFHHHHSSHGFDGFKIGQIKEWLKKEGFVDIKIYLVKFDCSNKRVWQKPYTFLSHFGWSHFCFFAKKSD